VDKKLELWVQNKRKKRIFFKKVFQNLTDQQKSLPSDERSQRTGAGKQTNLIFCLRLREKVLLPAGPIT
jgi:uncharacterized protein YbcC (UPF0753/DUF2309 family)